MSKKVALRTADGFKLSAVFDQGTSEDCVIWMHGISVDKDEYLSLFEDGSRAIHSAGHSSLRFDFRGHGKSGGSTLDFTVVGQVLDSDAAIAYALKRSHRLSARSVHLVAASFGAPPAIFAALRHPDSIKSLTLISPVLSYRRTFLEPETQWAQEIFNSRALAKLESTGRLYFDKRFCIGIHLVEEMRLIHPDRALADVQQRVLVLHGDRDSMVPYNVTKDVCRPLNHVRLVTMKGIDHGQIAEGDEEGTSAATTENTRRMFDLIRRHIEC